MCTHRNKGVGETLRPLHLSPLQTYPTSDRIGAVEKQRRWTNMNIEILVVRERGLSFIAELNAYADVMAMVKEWRQGKEGHIIVTADSENADLLVERINAFDSVVRAYAL